MIERDFKTCPQCAQTLPIIAFHHNRTQPDGRSGWCGICQNSGTRRWRAEHPEYEEAHAAARRTSRKVQCPTCQKDWVKTGPGNQIYCSPECRPLAYVCQLPHKGRCIGCGKEWVSNQPHRAFHSKNCRRKTVHSLLALGERDSWTCYLCGVAVDPNAFGMDAPSRDHIVPVALGGKDSRNNLALAHLGCNLAKHVSPCFFELKETA